MIAAAQIRARRLAGAALFFLTEQGPNVRVVYRIAIVAIMIALLAASLHFLVLIRERQQVVGQVARYNIAWLASQAVVELYRLKERLAAFQINSNPEGEDEVRMRYDILVSRSGLLNSGEFAEFAKVDPARSKAVERFQTVITDAEDLVRRLPDRDSASRLMTQLSLVDTELLKIAAAANRFGGDRVAAEQAELARLHHLFTYMVGGLFLCGVLLITSGHLQNRALSRAHARLEGLMAELKRTTVSKGILDAALNNMSQGLCMYDAEHRLIMSNRQFNAIYGLPDGSVQPGTVFLRVLEAKKSMGSYPDRTTDQVYAERQAVIAQRKATTFYEKVGADRMVAVSLVPMESGGWVATYEDITERKRAEAQIAHMARYDTLTGLPNRVFFREALDQALAQVQAGKRLSVLCLDLDRFKSVNDTLGHPIGDALLKAVAVRLQGCVRDGDTVARLGGDEFAIVQVGIKNGDDPSILAQRIIETLSAPYEILGHQVVIGTSVGIAFAPDDSQCPDQLLKSADMALYRAKHDGRGTYRCFEPEMDARMQARRSLELDLRKALSSGEFELYYQPLVELETNRVSGFEALLRWNHPERGSVSPADFIPLAEEIGLIRQIGAWVLKQACAEAATWPNDVRLAVNLSPAQFQTRTLVLDVISALGFSGLPARRLELEITETVMLQDTEATLATLYQLRELGVRISMDDFGTGYSSLSYLRQFPFDKIKIDRSFITDLPDGSDAVAIVKAVTGLGTSLGMSTTAEGVETMGQLEKLKAEGCTEVQGWLFSPARPASEVAGLLASVAEKSRAAA